MNVEVNRLETFSDWPFIVGVYPAKIAKVGFFYTKNAQTVECFACHLQISNWNHGDQVLSLHRSLSPDCPFVKDPINSGNIPLPPTVPSSSTITNLQNEEDRLATFENWPVSHIVTPTDLAKSGFYYLKDRDRTKCAFCQGIVMSWEPGDNPDMEHKRHFPRCSYVNSVITPRLFLNKPSTPNNNIALAIRSAEVNQDGDSLNALGVFMHQGPKHLQYATIEARLRTFTLWPAELIQTPDILAPAGFYYEGVSDQVRCFHCDGGLRNWDPIDDPWTEHARWFPTCSFVKLVKGQEFVQACNIESGPTNDQEKRRGPSVSTQEKPVPKPVIARREVTEREVQEHISSPVAIAALNIGLNLERIKRAIREKLEQTGRSYSQPDALVEAALNLQHDEDDSITETDDSSNVRRQIRQIPQPNTYMPMDTLDLEINVKERTPTSVKSQTDTKPVTLEEENRQLKEARLCKICMDIEVGIVFLPCGHLATCVNCAPNLEACPVCRSAIKATVRTFLS
ncbi:unnamed protein product [Brassicogethes aeneus]|uniref:RING-type domain-containing protein n=1 Tax=Brassicogethes aeneus TaxID=1431903 RepID=A0A9P0AZB7_BRAAE|nr:unnamed protein product [Brassicogethes aeneus]